LAVSLVADDEINEARISLQEIRESANDHVLPLPGDESADG